MPEGGPLSEEARREQSAPQRGIANVAVQPDLLLRGGVTPERAEESGRGTARGFARGLREGEAEVENAMGQVMGSARSFMPDSPAERGPLSDLGRTGPAMMETMAAGISGRPIESALSDALAGLPDEKEFASSIRPQAETLSLPSVPDQTMGIRPKMRGSIPSVEPEEQRFPLRPDVEGAVPTPEPASTQAPAEQLMRDVQVGPRAAPSSPPAQNISIDVSPSVDVTIEGNASEEEVRQGVEQGLSDAEFERQLRRVLEHEKSIRF